MHEMLWTAPATDRSGGRTFRLERGRCQREPLDFFESAQRRNSNLCICSGVGVFRTTRGTALARSTDQALLVLCTKKTFHSFSDVHWERPVSSRFHVLFSFSLACFVLFVSSSSSRPELPCFSAMLATWDRMAWRRREMELARKQRCASCLGVELTLNRHMGHDSSLTPWSLPRRIRGRLFVAASRLGRSAAG